MTRWKLHIPKSDKDLISKYKCGLRVGDFVALRKDLIIRNYRNRPTGKVCGAGEMG